MSYKAGFLGIGESKYSYNALRFKTKEECEMYARDLFNRWFGASAYRVEHSDDSVNYKIVDHKLIPLRE